MQEDIRNIPVVRNFLLDIAIYDRLDEMAETHELPEERLDELLDLTDAIIQGKIEAEKMPDLLVAAFGVESDLANSIAADLAGYRLLPLVGFLPGVDDLITKWGGDLEAYPKRRIDAARIQAEQWIEDLAEEMGLELPDHLMKRFVYLSRAYVTKERAKQPTEVLFMRPINIGGLALTKEQADTMIELLDEKAPKEENVGAIHESPVEEGEEVGDGSSVPAEVITEARIEEAPAEPVLSVVEEGPVPAQTPSAPSSTLPLKATAHALTKEVPVISGHVFDDEPNVGDGSSVPAQEPIETVQDALEAPKGHKHIDELIEEAAKPHIPLFRKKKVTKKASRSLARAFVVGMRDEKQTRSLFESRHNIIGDNLEAVMGALGEARDVFESQSAHAAKETVPAKTGVQEKEPEVHKLEREVLDHRHAALTGEIPKQKVDPVLPNARVSAARKKEHELTVQKENIRSKKLDKALEKERPKPVKAHLSKSSLPPKGDGTVQKVADIKKATVLIGPVEEIGTMTQEEFRRLSSDPAEAALKLEHKFALLEETRYEDRIAAVKAWRKSPLYRLYVEMTRTALQEGASLAEIAAKRRGVGEETLSPVEVKAITALNAKIRF